MGPLSDRSCDASRACDHLACNAQYNGILIESRVLRCSALITAVHRKEERAHAATYIH